MMITTEFSEQKQAWIELRLQANFWKTQHAKAIEREARLKIYARTLEKTVAEQAVKIKELTKQVEDLTAQVAWLKQRVFGQKTEQSKILPADSADPDGSSVEKLPRGQQKGTQGHGRRLRTNLPAVEIIHDLKEQEKQCPRCHLPFIDSFKTEDSEEIHYEMRLVRRIHRRKSYLRTCNCPALPAIITAPAPAKLIPKGMFSTEFWVYILTEKYLFQRPMSRILQTLALEGLDIPQGTITGGLERIKNFVYPLYTRILEKSRQAKHWHIDETRWMMFVTVEGKTGYKWWLWVVITRQTVVYILDPSRSAAVPKNHLPDNPRGIISADRYSVYKSLLSENLQISFCWSHVRRDYTRIHDTRPKLRLWAKAWLERINNIFHLNDQRLEVRADKAKFSAADRKLRQALDLMEQTYKKELNTTDLHPVKYKTLNSLKDHWTGLLIFVDHPEIPMDNNISERSLREPVLGRKNYYGCAALWSGELAAALWTIFQTARLNKIHPREYLKYYLTACAENGGRPPENITGFLPWNLSKEQKQAWQYPGKHAP